jgi:hypothetical protein
MVDIKGIDKAELLAALWNNSKQQGMSFLDPNGYGTMSVDRARDILADRATLQGYTHYFDYLDGRVMKVDLQGDEMREDLYDRDVGQGEVQRIVDKLRQREAA